MPAMGYYDVVQITSKYEVQTQCCLKKNIGAMPRVCWAVS